MQAGIQMKNLVVNNKQQELMFPKTQQRSTKRGKLTTGTNNLYNNNLKTHILGVTMLTKALDLIGHLGEMTEILGRAQNLRMDIMMENIPFNLTLSINQQQIKEINRITN